VNKTLSVQLQLALLRHCGARDADGQPVADMERAAEAAGRRVHAVEGPHGGALLVLGWNGHDPGVGSQPRIARRQLTVGNIKVLLVGLALLSDGRRGKATASLAEIATVVEWLTGKSSMGIVSAAVEILTRAGLLSQSGDELALGPVALTWDAQTRDTVGAAVQRLHEYPGWEERTA
jgi:hypothetical protein